MDPRRSARTGGSTQPAPARRLLRAHPRVLLAAALVAVGLAGAALGLLLVGSTAAGVGPVETQMSLRPSLTGDTVVEVPPLGSLTLDSHDGALGLSVQVARLNAQDARQIVADPASLSGLGETIIGDLRTAVVEVVVCSVVAATIGAIAFGLLVFRRVRRALICGAVALGAVAGSAAVAAATWQPGAINEPRYDGLLASAPTVVGNAASIRGNFARYEEQLAKIVNNVSVLYDAGLSLPVFSPDEHTVRVLHVSDIHLNPAAWDIIRSIAQQFQVDAVVDSGDLTDHGSALEASFVENIATVGVPYLYVRGNHDSSTIQARVAQQGNAVVLDDGEVVEVAGLRFAGWGDPRFTPDQSSRTPDAGQRVLESGERLAEALRAQPDDAQVDVAVVHDPAAAAPLDGLVPLVLAGHGHSRETYLLPEGTRIFEQGSTGGAGLRGLEGEEPTPVQASVLYFDRQTGALRAWDDITLGGLGLASAQISRQLPEELVQAPATPVPLPPVPAQAEGGDSGDPADPAAQPVPTVSPHPTQSPRPAQLPRPPGPQPAEPVG